MSEDWINVRNIRAFGHHGVTDRERTNGQVFEADVSLRLDLSRASRTDCLADTIGSEPCRLLERVAGRLADALLSAYPQVEQVVVRVRKPGAARALRSSAVEVELKRCRETESTGR